MRKTVFTSFRIQLLLSVIGTFILLVLSTTYILFSTIKMQDIADNRFQQEQFIKSLQDSLTNYQEPFLEFLSARSSNALATLLIESQNLRNRIPQDLPVSRNPVELREREVYSMIRSYLDLADQVIDEKRGRNITGYTQLYDEMDNLLTYINTEIATISAKRFQSQLDDYGIFISDSRDIQSCNLLFIISVSLFAIMILIRSVRIMTDPLIRLSAMASELSEGNFGIEDIKMSSVYEIDHVVEAFNQMKNDIKVYIEEIRSQKNVEQEYMQEKVRNFKMEELVHRMEIYTLQAQMNPHFLFNTLNTGLQLAIVEGADRTSEFMEYLSKLFRHNIRNKNTMAPFRNEIEGLEYYFYILKIRFPNNLDLVLDYPEELLDSCKIPVSILQPLVENSIVHAFKDMERKQSIIVRAEKKEDTFILTVTDNGCGITQEKIKELLSPKPVSNSSSRVMGLENVIQRLYFFYPENPDVIEIKSTPGQGTSIIIKINLESKPCTEF